MQTSTTVRRQYHHGDLRAALIRAGNELLKEQGNYETLSLRAVAARAQVSHTAPYNHFADRRALLAGIASEGFRQLLERLSASANGNAEEGVIEAARAYLDFAREEPASYRLMFVSDVLVGSTDPETIAISTATYKLLETRIAAVLRGHRAPGAVTAVLWAQLHGLALLLQANRIRPWMRDGASDERLAEAMLAATLASLSATGPALEP